MNERAKPGRRGGVGLAFIVGMLAGGAAVAWWRPAIPSQPQAPAAKVIPNPAEPKAPSPAPASAPKAEGTVVHGSSNPLDPESLAAMRKRRDGEAVLERDIPRVQALRERAVASGTKYAMETSGKDYEKLFTAYGFDEETRQRMLSHISAIYEARTLAQNELSQLVRARSEYERQMKNLLGDAYPEYARHEALSQGRSELAALDTLAQKQGTALREDERSAVLALIAESAAYTQESTNGVGGVFLDWPRPAIGDGARASFTVRLQEAERHFEAVMAQAQQRGLSAETQRLLETYYRNAVEAARQLVPGPNGEPSPMEQRARQRMDEARTQAQESLRKLREKAGK